MSVAVLYPGQAAQIPGMLHHLPDRAQATWTLQQASQVLGRDVLTLDKEQALSSTVPVQLALFLSGVAATVLVQFQINAYPQQVGANAEQLIALKFPFRSGSLNRAFAPTIKSS